MTTLISDNEILNSFNSVLPYLSILFDDEASIAITNREVYLLNHNCPSLKLKAVPGDPIPEGGAASEAIRTGKVIIRDVPKEIYGVPFKSYAIPVLSNGTVAGCILLGKSLSKKHELHNAYKNQTMALQQISDSVTELSSELQNIVTMNNEIQQNATNTEKNTKSTDDILQMIRHISSQTNLLGINASIEAARAGEVGKGFNVVAQEIRSLSGLTNESIKKIEQILKQTNTSIKEISSKVNSANIIFQSQAAAFEEIAAAVKELTSSANTLEDMSEKI